MSREGNNVIFGSAATIAFLASGAYDAHQRGIAAVRAARQAEDDARYENAVAEVVRDAEEMGKLAMRLAQELAAERQKNESLTRALNQRQALLERMRKA
ncbi:hypothetical protein [Ochrobactrum soli]|uniref:Uncharacterized protein n=1 Tax=Ochrobactrum soli TaxID=2448455 RepID=A0A2P9HNN3_9HYPH|nr:hypothetical protein [[Ochrobactrum] soli]SPL65745.1 hypothetical protein OHAE_1612 [[Ochrobactrum] soli]